MRTIHRAAQSALITLGVVSLAMPAYSQGMSRGGKGGKQQNEQQTVQKKKDAEALDKAYRAGLDRDSRCIQKTGSLGQYTRSERPEAEAVMRDLETRNNQAESQSENALSNRGANLNEG